MAWHLVRLQSKLIPTLMALWENSKGLTKESSLEQSVRDDLALLKASPLVRKELAENAKGFVYDIKTGLLTPVEA